MTTLAALFAKPLHVITWRRPLFSTDLRVTNPYDGPDLVNGGIHRATDAGSYNRLVAGSGMNVPVIAPMKCPARGLHHYDGALGVDFSVGPNLSLQVWHLGTTLPVDPPSGKTTSAGPWQLVDPGQQVGLTGQTGLGTGAHSHIELWDHGARIDPEPYLEMVEKPAIPLPEEDMKLSGTFVRHVVNRQGRLTANTNFRRGVTPDDNGIIAVLPATALFIPTVVVKGLPAGTAPDREEYYGGIKTAVPGAPGDWFGYVHSSLLPRTPDGKGVALDPIEAGFTAEDMAAAKVQGRAEMKRDIQLAVSKVPA